MNGFIGIVSRDNVVPDLLHGLLRLDDTRHNSCGVVVHGRQGHTQCPPRLHRHRRTQRASLWLEHMAQAGQTDLSGLQGLAGLAYSGHTSACGPQALTHALPHLSHGPGHDLNSPARIALVMHGQVHASQALREALCERGYHFKSASATEVLVHLIDAAYQSDPVQAVHRALALVEGALAVAVVFQDQPGRLIAARSGAPLWLATSELATFVSSSAAGLPCNTGQLTPLGDGDVVDLHHDRSTTDGPDRSVHQSGRGQHAVVRPHTA